MKVNHFLPICLRTWTILIEEIQILRNLYFGKVAKVCQTKTLNANLGNQFVNLKKIKHINLDVLASVFKVLPSLAVLTNKYKVF